MTLMRYLPYTLRMVHNSVMTVYPEKFRDFTVGKRYQIPKTSKIFEQNHVVSSASSVEMQNINLMTEPNFNVKVSIK